MSEEKTFSEDYVKELRSESANYRVKLREAESKLEQLEQERQKSRESLLEKEISFAAKELGAVDPQTIAKLINKEDIAEDMSNVSELVKGLVDEKPFLKGGDIGRASNPADSNPIKIFTRQEVDRMSPDEVNANWDSIQEQMSKGLIK